MEVEVLELRELHCFGGVRQKLRMLSARGRARSSKAAESLTECLECLTGPIQEEVG